MVFVRLCVVFVLVDGHDAPASRRIGARHRRQGQQPARASQIQAYRCISYTVQRERTRPRPADRVAPGGAARPSSRVRLSRPGDCRRDPPRPRRLPDDAPRSRPASPAATLRGRAQLKAVTSASGVYCLPMDALTVAQQIVDVVRSAKIQEPRVSVALQLAKDLLEDLDITDNAAALERQLAADRARS